MNAIEAYHSDHGTEETALYLGLAKRYGPAAAEAACARALDVDVINVSKIESMLVNATEKNQAVQAAAPAGTGRFARDPAEYATATGIRLQVVDGGSRL